jgi:MtN3 and saliva related transmembrane protein
MRRFKDLWFFVLLLSLFTLCGCQDLVPRDTSSLFIPRFQRSEILGFVAGLGTTFAAEEPFYVYWTTILPVIFG